MGYQGAKFSGVPLASERILLGHRKGVFPKNILPSLDPIRTSKSSTAPSKAMKWFGYAEPTATIMWGLIQKMSVSPDQIILWNSFPFHPFQKAKGRLTNRPPRGGELSVGSVYLEMLLELCPSDIKLIVVGEKAAATLGQEVPKVHHPANGGAALFREQLSRLIS